MFRAESPIPATVHVAPMTQRLCGTPHIPGSKYVTVRAAIIAALADGVSQLDGLAISDDTRVLLGALQRLGIQIDWLGPDSLRVTGCAGRWPTEEPIAIDVGNAGAVLRLLLGVCATLPEVTFTTPYPESLGQRPNADLLDALRQLGVEVTAQGDAGLLPITLRGGNVQGGAVEISGALSSQYISALLLLAPLIGAELTITATGELRSATFINLTGAMMRQAGVIPAQISGKMAWRVPSPQTYQARQWHIPRDFPTAALWLALGAVAGEAIALREIDSFNNVGFITQAYLERMGAQISMTTSATRPHVHFVVKGNAPLHGAELDGEPIIDCVPALAAAACFAAGTTTFTRVGTLRLKESNRIDDLCAEFNRAGAEAIPGPDSITIVGHPEGIAGGVTVDAHHDHRLAMALAILALRSRQGLTITGADHVAKSYPAFWDELRRLGADVTA